MKQYLIFNIEKQQFYKGLGCGWSANQEDAYLFEEDDLLVESIEEGNEPDLELRDLKI